MFSGLSAFPITPASADGKIDSKAFSRLIERLVAAKVDSIGILGSTGSYPYLSRDQRRRAIETAREVTGGKVPLLVGSGALRTDEAVDLAKDAEAAGTDALLLAPVSYLPLLDDEVFAHFEAVAAATGLPICIYNNPGTTHFTVSPALLARLATLPNVAAVKNPAPAAADVAAYHRSLAEAVDPNFSLGYSGDWNATEALIAGGKAWYSVAAGLFPKPCLRISRAVQAGDIGAARRLNADLEPLWALFRRYTSYRVVHAAARGLGLVDTYPPRPILPLSSEVEGEILSVLTGLGLAGEQTRMEAAK